MSDPMPLAPPIGTVAEVQKRLAYIERISDDDEAAHTEEDRLWLGVLTAIANHETTDDPAELAAEAIKTNDIEFARWCA